MLYFDTGFLIPLVLEEATSTRIERFLRRRSSEELAISRWTLVEFSSALAREVRMGALDAKSALDADRQFVEIATESFDILLPDSSDFELATQFIRRHETGLRAGDALHLAIASHHNARAIYSLDKTWLLAGKKLGLPVRAGIR